MGAARPSRVLTAVAVAAARVQATPGFPSDLDNEVPQARPGTAGWGAQVTATTRNKAVVLGEQPPVPLLPSDQLAPADVDITVDPSTSFQPIVGLGASLTESSAYAMLRASPAVQEALLNRLFGPVEKGGVRLSVIRLTVGVSDFSVNYGKGDISYDNVDGDYNLEHFSTAKDDAFLIPTIRRILAINPDITIMASPWTAPVWMKNSTGELGKGWLRDTPEVFSAYAEYLVRFLEDYNRKGVRIHYLTLQNEPGHGNCGPMPCMWMSPDQQIRLAQQVGQRLRSRGNPNISAVKLLAYDHNWGPDKGAPQRHSWNRWLVALLMLPVPVFFIVCALCAFVVGGLFRGFSARRVTVVDDNSDPEDNVDREDIMMREEAAHSGFLAQELTGEEETEEASGSESDSEPSPCEPTFKFGVCLGALLMLLAAWASVLLVCSLVRTGKVTDKILVDDLSRQFTGPDWPAEVLKSAGGSEFAGVAWHCYGGDPKVQSELRDEVMPYRSQELEQHMTECSGGDWSGPWEGSLVWNQKVIIMQNFNNHGRSCLQWNLALDENKGPHCSGGACCANCRGVVTVPSTAQSLDDIDFNVEFVGLAHHTAALRPGARRVSHTLKPEEKVHAVAYKNTDGHKVLVLVNEDEKHNTTVRVSCEGSGFRYSLAPGVATFRW